MLIFVVQETNYHSTKIVVQGIHKTQGSLRTNEGYTSNDNNNFLVALISNLTDVAHQTVIFGCVVYIALVHSLSRYDALETR